MTDTVDRRLDEAARRIRRLERATRRRAGAIKRWDRRLQAEARAQAYRCALEHILILRR